VEKKETGLIHIYCGNGKGKTTAAFGLGIRAAGRDKQVVIARFLKTEDSGEVFVLRQIPGIHLIYCEESFGFTFQMTKEVRRKAAQYYSRMFEQAVELAENRNGDLLILDEILPACQEGFVEKEKLEAFLIHKHKSLEVVLTGRRPWDKVLDLADYVTEMKQIRHPYEKGILAREGIEY
jgi:cob(I)alamin adenosyltransferase